MYNVIIEDEIMFLFDVLQDNSLQNIASLLACSKTKVHSVLSKKLKPKKENMSFESKVLKKHKLYYKHNSEIRSLSKSSFKLFMLVIDYFLLKGGQEEYQKINEGVKDWRDWKPITLIVPEELEEAYKLVINKQSVTLSYDGSWKPLVVLISGSKYSKK